MQHNLPAPLSKRFGRDREIATVGRLLAQARLLTLTGAGGIGKTTLALEVCRSLVASDPRRYPDGIWLVELAPTADQSLVAHTVASATHTPETPDQPATESLIRALRAKQALIVLDNCEHVIGATAELSERLLGQCPSLTILATSREPLNIAGELVWPVPPLPPEDGATLFAARAAEARPDFALTVAQAATVVEMCQQLDGLPLAIELAAATARSLAVEEVASRLGQRFNVLAAGKRTAPQRQQSLRAMVDWSYTRLSPQEQTLFARLSVFAAGWTLAAAEGICADGSDMLGLLHELVQKSLVAAEPRGPETRYRLLETLRQYAAEQLREAGEEAELRTRHLQWFLAFAEGAEPELSGADQFAWNDRVEVEHANIRAALGWARLDGHVEASLRLGAALRLWWLRRVHIVEGCEWLEDLLSKAGGRDGPRVRAKALNALAFLRLRQAQLQAAQRHAEEALKLARQSADQSQEALALVSLGHVERECGDAAASERR
ncbi:MAG TPA: NB-ARC domain-containing protein, partial [Chloroflexota bacterium]